MFRTVSHVKDGPFFKLTCIHTYMHIYFKMKTHFSFFFLKNVNMIVAIIVNKMCITNQQCISLVFSFFNCICTLLLPDNLGISTSHYHSPGCSLYFICVLTFKIITSRLSLLFSSLIANIKTEKSLNILRNFSLIISWEEMPGKQKFI